MPTAEMVFWEAASRSRSTSNSADRTRRCSTLTDDTGCVVTKGFLLPSRSSSQSSVARSTTSSFESTSCDTPGTPASPIEGPLPGYARPTGALYYAPEFAPLRTISSSSLCPPRAIHRHFRPGIGRRQTWQVGNQLTASGRLDDTDLGETECRPRLPTPAPTAQFVPAPMQATRMRRTQSDRVGLTGLHERSIVPGVAPTFTRRSKSNDRVTFQKRQVKIAPAHEAEDAITSDDDDGAVESDSDDDNAIGSDSDDENAMESESDHVVSDKIKMFVGGITALRNKPDYATRRRLADERAAQMNRGPLEVQQLDMLAVRLAQKLEVVSASQAEDAIASDSEDDEDDDYSYQGDRKMSAALELARYHRDCNSITVTVENSPSKYGGPSAFTTAAIENSPTKSSVWTSWLSVKTIPRLQDTTTADEVTPVEIKSFDMDARLGTGSLRPSRAQPKPIKGVLKKTDRMPSPPRRVKTQISGENHVHCGLHLRSRSVGKVYPKDTISSPASGVFLSGSVSAADLRQMKITAPSA